MRISIIIILFFLSACTPCFEPVCRHKAVLAAITAGEYFPVRIASGPNYTGGRHAQAEAKINGIWEWLSIGSNNLVYVSGQDNFNPDEYSSVDYYFATRFGDE